MKKILLSLFSITAIAAIAFGATQAFFSDTETSVGNTLVAGAIDLKVDNTCYYNGMMCVDGAWAGNVGIGGSQPCNCNWDLKDLDTEKFFSLQDLKPGDWEEDTISLHVNDNDSWLCADVTLTSNEDNGLTEPETDDGDVTGVGSGSGELADRINFLWWADDGDNVLEVGEETLPAGPMGVLDIDQTATVALADSQTNIWGSGPFPGGETKYIGKGFCFGTLTEDPVAQGDNNSPTIDPGFDCDGATEDNTTQTDSFTADISFRAVQHRNNPDFLCGGAEITPTQTPTPTPPLISCEPNDVQFASSSANNNQGLRKDGTAVLANRSVPSSAFGAPQSTGVPVDPPVPAGSFFSLGFPHANNGNTPGSIVYGFTLPFFNGPGDDLQVFEVTGATTPAYPDEIVKVEIGPTSGGPWTVVAAAAIRDELIDIAPNVSAQFVRLTDVSDPNLFTGTGDATPDGYDLDAVKAFCRATEID